MTDLTNAETQYQQARDSYVDAYTPPLCAGTTEYRIATGQ